MSSGYGVPLAAQDYTWCWGSNMEPCWTSCRFAVRPSSEPGPLERARCAHSVNLLQLTATWVSLSDLGALVLFYQDHCSKVRKKNPPLVLHTVQKVCKQFLSTAPIIGGVTILRPHSAYKGMH